MAARSITCLILCAASASAQDSAFQQTIRPFLAKHCISCHNEKLTTGNLDLARFQNAALAAQHPEIWRKALDKLNAGKMPPPGLPVPSKPEKAAVIAALENI